MTIPYSLEQARALAPDDKSLKAAQGLCNPAKWPMLGQDSSAVWGDCKGSGKRAYEVCIDLDGPGFSCSCPSHKFPCKHALALLIMAAEGRLSTASPPPRVTDWLNRRKQRAEKKAERAKKTAEKAADPKMREKRIKQRRERVRAGLEKLAVWLQDRVKRGFAELPGKPYSFWSEPASRLVDAQVPALASELYGMGRLVGRDNDWPARMAARCGRLQLIIDGFSRIDSLPEPVQADLHAALGIPLKQEEVLAFGRPVSDAWLVLGQRVENEDRLTIRRTWLQGQGNGRPALVLEFHHEGGVFDLSWPPGMIVDADLVFYPGAVPLRAIQVARRGQPQPLSVLPGCENIARALLEQAQMLAKNPWLDRLPMALKNLVPVAHEQELLLCDANRQILRVSPGFPAVWELLAVSGGRPLTIFGEWEQKRFYPLSCDLDGFINLNEVAA